MIDSKNKELHILGYSAINLPLLMELANESLGSTFFNVYPNLHDISEPKITKELACYKYSFKSQEEVNEKVKKGLAILGVTNPFAKKKVFEYFQNVGVNRSNMTNLIHLSSYLSPSALIEQAVLIEPLVSVSSQTKIGFGVTIKRSSTVGHHNEIGDFTSINPGCVISGNVKIGSGCTIGSGAVIRDSVEIGANTIIGVGSVVTKDIPANAIAFGTPCRKVKDNI